MPVPVMLPAIRMDPRERKILNDNAKKVVPYDGAIESVDITGEHLVVEMWDDLRFPATQAKRGSLDKPDFDFTEIGLLFPRNDTAEAIYMIAQMPHGYQWETALKPHVHYVQSSSAVPVFKLAYRWYKIGASIPSFTTITSTTNVVTYVSGSIHQLMRFPDIAGTGINGLSSILDMKLWRDDNVVAGNVLVKEFDIHYRFDTLGSLQEIIKF